MVTEALGVSITTFSAQNFGARNYERMRKGYHTSLVLSFMLIGGLSAVLLVFSGPLSRLFVDDALISAYTTTILHFIAPFYAIFSIIENASGSIRGAGVSLQPMMLTIFGTVVLRVIWVFAIMPFDPSLEHLLLVYPVTCSLRPRCSPSTTTAATGSAAPPPSHSGRPQWLVFDALAG